MPRSALDGTSASTRSQIEKLGLPMLLTPAEAARQLSLSRYTDYELVKAGRLRGRRFGRVILIPREELQRFTASLEQK